MRYTWKKAATIINELNTTLESFGSNRRLKITTRANNYYGLDVHDVTGRCLWTESIGTPKDCVFDAQAFTLNHIIDLAQPKN